MSARVDDMSDHIHTHTHTRLWKSDTVVSENGDDHIFPNAHLLTRLLHARNATRRNAAPLFVGAGITIECRRRGGDLETQPVEAE